jgi:hypothetical protein
MNPTPTRLREDCRLPEVESFAFGVNECAACAKGGALVRRRLFQTVWADHAKTEVLIPAGAQKFHRECYRTLLLEDT